MEFIFLVWTFTLSYLKPSPIQQDSVILDVWPKPPVSLVKTLKHSIDNYHCQWRHFFHGKNVLKSIFIFNICSVSSVHFSHSVVSDCLRPHESQLARPLCPSPTPGVHPDSCPSSPWCHPAISSCRPLLLLPPIPPSIKVFSNESTLRMRWPKYWSFSFSSIPSKGHPRLIFRMDWLDLLAVQGTLKSLQ